MLKLIINASGHSISDLEDALNEAVKRFKEGNVSGADRNDLSSFSFGLSGRDDQEGLEQAGWTYDGESWSKGRKTRKTYTEAVNLEGLSGDEKAEPGRTLNTPEKTRRLPAATELS